MSSLPIDKVLPDLESALDLSNLAILHAPPGAGKTTRVPLCLLKVAWAQDKRIIMLEPRRLAARAAAYRMADTLNESVGMTVGYRTRFDSQISAQTKVEVVTEGILTRMLQQDPELGGVACIIFDEFHERSLNADLGLALVLDVQAALRDDLRIVIMSATLNMDALVGLLPNAPVITSMGRSYPVDIHYLGGGNKRALIIDVINAVKKALSEESGSVLVFLPGESEIRQVLAGLPVASLDENTTVLPLFGALSREAQDQAIEACSVGKRKVVLATAIAETSLTIEGVRIVIDAGLMRVARFDSNVGMSRLFTLRVSLASAEQRCGRAGRVEPGVCYRMWSAEQHKGLVKFHAAEILSADLTPMALELAQWGVHSPDELRWLDDIPRASFEKASALLRSLGALDERHRITAHGGEMLTFGLHPRLAHMVLMANKLGAGSLACEVAALLAERDIFKRHNEGPGVDLQFRLEALQGDKTYGHVLDRSTLKRVLQSAKLLKRKLPKGGQGRGVALGVLLAMAYPDRVSSGRDNHEGRLLLSSGKGARIDLLDTLAQTDFIVAAKLGGLDTEPYVHLGCAVEKDDLFHYFAERIVKSDECFWDEGGARLRARSQTRFGALTLDSKTLKVDGQPHAQDVLLTAIRESKLKLLCFSKENKQWLARLRLISTLIDAGTLQPQIENDWPSVLEDDLIASLHEWLGPYLDAITTGDQLKRLNMAPILMSMLTWQQQQWLDDILPTYYEVPTGSRIAIDYLTEDGPVLAVRLQELFGLAQTPSVAQGRLKLKLHLLSPARRPIQITRDLTGFWSGSYEMVKKEMKGRYPKHYWPDDPLNAEPTTRVKNRR